LQGKNLLPAPGAASILGLRKAQAAVPRLAANGAIAASIGLKARASIAKSSLFSLDSLGGWGLKRFPDAEDINSNGIIIRDQGAALVQRWPKLDGGQ
jgi:hypothetical protein